VGLGPGVEIDRTAVEGVAVLRRRYGASPEVGLKVAGKGHGALIIIAGGLVKLELRRQGGPKGGLARAGCHQVA
jgi:hypothetical protein